MQCSRRPTQARTASNDWRETSIGSSPKRQRSDEVDSRDQPRYSAPGTQLEHPSRSLCYYRSLKTTAITGLAMTKLCFLLFIFSWKGFIADHPVCWERRSPVRLDLQVVGRAVALAFKAVRAAQPTLTEPTSPLPQLEVSADAELVSTCRSSPRYAVQQSSATSGEGTCCRAWH